MEKDSVEELLAIKEALPEAARRAEEAHAWISSLPSRGFKDAMTIAFISALMRAREGRAREAGANLIEVMKGLGALEKMLNNPSGGFGE